MKMIDKNEVLLCEICNEEPATIAVPFHQGPVLCAPCASENLIGVVVGVTAEHGGARSRAFNGVLRLDVSEGGDLLIYDEARSDQKALVASFARGTWYSVERVERAS